MKLLRILAVLFGLLAISNFLKPVGFSEDQGFVFMGRRLDGTQNLIAAWTFGVFLSWYASSLWRGRAAALPIGIAYACYVSANLFLWVLRQPAPPPDKAWFGIAYMIVALGTSWGAVFAMIKAGFARHDPTPGRVLLRSFALLFAWMALSNTLKPFSTEAATGFVLLGERLSGTPNTIAGFTFAALLAAYAASIWRESSLALKLGLFYAAYVIVNLVLWSVRKPEGADAPLIFALPYLVSAIGVSSGSAFLLWKHRERLS
jgi:hypothetical protein